jgi:acetolactate synthase I/II/III large subunit
MEDVEKTIAEFLDNDQATVLDMVVDRGENVYPMIPAGAAHYDMQLRPGQKVEIDEDKAAYAV